MKTPVLAVAVAVLSGAIVAAEPARLTFVTNVNENHPFLIGNSDSLAEPNPGIAVEIIRLTGKELGIEIEIKRMPWKRALEVQVASGGADGAFFASYAADREAFGAYPMKGGKPDESRSYARYTYLFYKRKDSGISFDGKAVSGLAGPVGVSRGYSVGAELSARGLALDESNNPTQDFTKLMYGRVNLIAALQDNAAFILASNPEFGKAIEPLPVPISSKPYYLILSRQLAARDPRLAERIWDTLALVSRREFAGLIRKYMAL